MLELRGRAAEDVDFFTGQVLLFILCVDIEQVDGRAGNIVIKDPSNATTLATVAAPPSSLPEASRSRNDWEVERISPIALSIASRSLSVRSLLAAFQYAESAKE